MAIHGLPFITRATDGRDVEVLPANSCPLCSKPLQVVNPFPRCWGCDNDDTRVDGENLERVFAASVYVRVGSKPPVGVIGPEIYRLKEGDEAVVPGVAEILRHRIAICQEDLSTVSLVTFPPRGTLDAPYNQSERLAGIVAEELGADLVPTLSNATGYTPSHKLSGMKKIGEEEAASMTCDLLLKDVDVLVVDDVYNTGRTMIGAAKALKRAGASRVRGLVLARAVDPKHLKTMGYIATEAHIYA